MPHMFRSSNTISRRLSTLQRIRPANLFRHICLGRSAATFSIRSIPQSAGSEMESTIDGFNGGDPSTATEVANGSEYLCDGSMCRETMLLSESDQSPQPEDGFRGGWLGGLGCLPINSRSCRWHEVRWQWSFLSSISNNSLSTATYKTLQRLTKATAPHPSTSLLSAHPRLSH